MARGLESSIGGGLANRAPGDRGTVGGGWGNAACGTASTSSGGYGNSAMGDYSTLGGGRFGCAEGSYAVVSGGTGNEATGDFGSVGGGAYNAAVAPFSVVAGGNLNFAYGALSVVGGGRDNDAHGRYATVGGGFDNEAFGRYATIVGGVDNRTTADYAFAAGRRAMAQHPGAFVWGDSFGAYKTSSAPDEFNVYASGGARIFSDTAASTGVLLAPGAGSWTSVSDRAAKENVDPVDAREVLERVLALPISTWNYRAQGPDVRHMGPMAQDFHAAFRLGLGARSIDTVDPDGVALAAIQGLDSKLARRVAEQQAEIRELRRRLEALEGRVE